MSEPAVTLVNCNPPSIMQQRLDPLGPYLPDDGKNVLFLAEKSRASSLRGPCW